jgi:hypothetical protein
MNKTELLVYIDKKFSECSTKNTNADTSTVEGRNLISFIGGQISILQDIYKLIQ